MRDFKRYTIDANGNKIFHLKDIEWKVYGYLEKNSDRWVSKSELMDAIPELRVGETNHDECALLNSCRLWLLEALRRDMISHIVMVKNNSFKLASNDLEVDESAQKEMDSALRHLIRYWTITKAVKLDGQGRLFDKKGNVIDEKSLAKRFNQVLVD